MAIKYFVLAFIAIQGINAGVIKPKSPESEFQDLYAEIQEFANKCASFTKDIENAYAQSIGLVLGIANMVAMASHTNLDELERVSVGQAPWSVKCFENVHNLVDEISMVLLANTNECINSAEPSVVEHLKSTINFQQNVKLFADQIKEEWDKCSDSQCQNDIIATARDLLESISKAFAVLTDYIAAFLQDNFKDLRMCSEAAAEEHYFVHLKEIIDNVQKCIDAGPIKTD